MEKLFVLRSDSLVAIFSFKEDPHEHPWLPGLEELAAAYGVPLYRAARGGGSSTHELIKGLYPDLIFIVGWRFMVTMEAVSMAKLGCVVFHDSLLPRYRGFAPMNWAIINGETKTGMSMIYLAEQIDSGDIIDQREVDIEFYDDAARVNDKLCHVMLQMLEENLPLLERGEAPRIEQDHSLATYTCKRTPEDGRIDWSKDTLSIYNLIRGLSQPYPGAFTFINGNRMQIWKASVVKNGPKYVGRIPGRVVKIGPEGSVNVLTGNGLLSIERVQLANSPELGAAAIIKSIKTQLG